MRLFEYLNERLTQVDMRTLKNYVDKFFNSLGVDVQFTNHFLDQANASRNDPEINIDELRRAFNKAFKQHGLKISKLSDGTQAVIRDAVTDVNIPFVFEWNPKSGRFDLVPKSVMRKRGFTTQNPTFDIKPEMLPK
jgi:hypothetical protein